MVKLINMQTFLPLPDFQESARVLDRVRLGRQRVEGLQILKALRQGEFCLYDRVARKYLYGESLENVGSGKVVRVTPWFRHATTRMWYGHELALLLYTTAVCNEWIGRGYKDTCLGKTLEYTKHFNNTSMPDWFGDPRVHSSHRAALLAKNPKWYSQYGWAESPEINYFWPK